MKNREKILAATAAGVFLLLLGWWIIESLLLGPARKLDTQIATFSGEIAVFENQNAREGFLKARLKEYSERFLGFSETNVTDALSANMMSLREPANLTGTVTSVPIAGTIRKTIYKEVARKMDVSGSLPQIVNFLYLLDSQDYLHRVDAITNLSRDSNGNMNLSVRYSTLVPSWPGAQAASTQPATAPDTLIEDLGTPQRAEYDAIIARDIFRPYVKRPPVVAVATPPVRTTTVSTPPAVPRGGLKVVSLSSFGDKSDVVVQNTSTYEIKYYKPGDKLSAGEVVMVDYRRLPMPGQPEVLSYSRVILKVGPDYYAVELGQDLSDRHPLKSEDWPEQLRAAASQPAQPATAPAPAGASERAAASVNPIGSTP